MELRVASRPTDGVDIPLSPTDQVSGSYSFAQRVRSSVLGAIGLSNILAFAGVSAILLCPRLLVRLSLRHVWSHCLSSSPIRAVSSSTDSIELVFELVAGVTSTGVQVRLRLEVAMLLAGVVVVVVGVVAVVDGVIATQALRDWGDGVGIDMPELLDIFGLGIDGVNDMSAGLMHTELSPKNDEFGVLTTSNEILPERTLFSSWMRFSRRAHSSIFAGFLFLSF